eukprot:5577340-Pleurochrysis_carterae.AAC.1
MDPAAMLTRVAMAFPRFPMLVLLKASARLEEASTQGREGKAADPSGVSLLRSTCAQLLWASFS